MFLKWFKGIVQLIIIFVLGDWTIEVLNTVESRSNGFQGTDQFYLLKAEFCYSQWRIWNKMGSRDQELVSVRGGAVGAGVNCTFRVRVGMVEICW